MSNCEQSSSPCSGDCPNQGDASCANQRIWPLNVAWASMDLMITIPCHNERGVESIEISTWTLTRNHRPYPGAQVVILYEDGRRDHGWVRDETYIQPEQALATQGGHTFFIKPSRFRVHRKNAELRIEISTPHNDLTMLLQATVANLDKPTHFVSLVDGDFLGLVSQYAAHSQAYTVDRLECLVDDVPTTIKRSMIFRKANVTVASDISTVTLNANTVPLQLSTDKERQAINYAKPDLQYNQLFELKRCRDSQNQNAELIFEPPLGSKQARSTWDLYQYGQCTIRGGVYIEAGQGQLSINDLPFMREFGNSQDRQQVEFLTTLIANSSVVDGALETVWGQDATATSA